MAINYKNYSAPDGQDLTLAFKFIAPVALDSRFAMDDIKGMLSEGVWKNNGTYLGYNGLLTYVGDNTLNIKKQYVLTDAGAHAKHLLTNKQLACINAITDRIPKPENILENLLGIPTSFTVISEGDNADPTFISELEKYWTNLASAGDVTASLEPLAGVFQFKGVATSITDDMDAISISTLTVTNTGAESPVSESGYELKSIQYDLTHQLFYGWKKTSPTNGFATEYYTTDKDSKVYTKLGESNIVYVDIDGERYYTLSTSEGYITSLQSLIGNTIYPESGIDSSALSYSSVNFYSNSTTKDNTTLVGQAIPQKNQAYMFSEVENFLVGNLTQIKVIPASGIVDGNTTTPVNGWVYQIGEKEYASNGLIWVELGSPKEEITWLVL